MAINGPELKEIISDDARLFLGAAIPDAYLTDALGRLHGEAEALVFPTSTEEVSQILRYAHAQPLRISLKKIGEANIICARRRPKYVGGQRAIYDESLL